MFTRQPCDPIPRPRDVGQWLCVPSFRMVCPYQAFTLAVNDAYFTRTQCKPHACMSRMTKSYFRYGRARAGKRMSSVNENEKCTREWAKIAGMDARAAGCPGNRRPCSGRPPEWSFSA